jgi:hypothetical protein
MSNDSNWLSKSLWNYAQLHTSIGWTQPKTQFMQILIKITNRKRRKICEQLEHFRFYKIGTQVTQPRACTQTD